jgi:hypothetical protein
MIVQPKIKREGSVVIGTREEPPLPAEMVVDMIEPAKGLLDSNQKIEFQLHSNVSV